MRACVRTATLDGVSAIDVDVEADVGRGLPGFTVVGMADTAVQEARERVRSAVRAAGFDFPNSRVLVNLAPAPLPKRGTGFDLPMAVAILAATGQVPLEVFATVTLVGELSLDGRVRPVTGLLAHAAAASRAGRLLVGPLDGSDAARRFTGTAYRPLTTLADLRGGIPLESPAALQDGVPASSFDLAQVVGHATARRALEVAAAGGHNLLLEGPPGSGKTLLARCLCGILPVMDESERLETALIHSVAGLDETSVLAGQRPFRAPHHASTVPGLIGGGRGPRPGEASLAHNGVLFLDEMTHFAPSVLQVLREPLEEGVITLVRADSLVAYPARFMLVGAFNPCPCGFYGDPSGRCRCTPAMVTRHRNRIGGPLLDRIDLHVAVGRIAPARLVECEPGESSAAVADRVRQAQMRAHARGDAPAARLSGRRLRNACRLHPDASRLLTEAASARGLSGRGVTRVLRVARTLADLDAADRVGTDHVLEAISFRTWDCPP